MGELGLDLGIHPWAALATVIATVILYGAFALVLRVWGQRMFASPSSFDLAVVTVLGAIVGRSTLGLTPTLSTGLISVGTLLVCEYAVMRARSRIRSERRRAIALIVAGQVDRAALGRHHIDDNALWTALRVAGVSGLDQVTLAVLEPTGRVSVLKSDGPVHESALTGVRDVDDVVRRLQGAGVALQTCQ